jgi:hypothetical protein
MDKLHIQKGITEEILTKGKHAKMWTGLTKMMDYGNP